MNNKWPTKDNDMQVAEQIIEEYANRVDSQALGLFELVLNPGEKRMAFRLSNWVVMLADYFMSQYGPSQGDYVTRKVISKCLVNGQTLH
jgi:hypothetical protein